MQLDSAQQWNKQRLTEAEANRPGKAAGRPQILIVEDDPADALLTCDAIQQHCANTELKILKDAAAAIRYLDQLGARGSIPALLMLDLDLPGDNGLTVLKWLRSKHFQSMPVVMFTGSESLRDRDEALALGAAAFVNKPLDLDEFRKIGELVREFIK